MSEERAAGRSKRPALIFRTGGVRFALEVSAVLEVTETEAPSSASAALPSLESEPVLLASLLSLPAEGRGGVRVVLAASPPRAFRLDAVEGVADLAGARHFKLPAGAATLDGIFRGALLLDGRLLLELAPEMLARLERAAPQPGPIAWKACGEWEGPPPERALVFEAGAGGAMAVPLDAVTRVLAAPDLLWLPGGPRGQAGLLHHERSLLAVFDPALLGGEEPTVPELVVALESGGLALGLLARKVTGVASGFSGPAGTCAGRGALPRCRRTVDLLSAARALAHSGPEQCVNRVRK